MSKLNFLLADRNVGPVASGLSIAATWVWAPALFVAAQQAYVNGWQGLAWFTIPNVLCLVIFARFAARVRTRLPDGFTLSGFMRDRYDRRVQGAYLTQLGALATCSFAVQLLAGGAILSAITGIAYAPLTVGLALLALAYSLAGGLKASVVTDYLQMGLLAAVAVALVPALIGNAGGLSTVAAGLDGTDAAVTGLALFLGFGLPNTIGLLSGPFGDQSFWQRAFATRSGQERRAFRIGAGVFAVVPVTMGLFGFVAAGAGVTVNDPQLTNLAALQAFLPSWTVVPFVAAVLSGLVSTLDSNLCSVSSLVGHDLTTSGTDRDVMRRARYGMVGLAAVAVAVANVPGMTVLYLFLIYGTLRASTLLPTVMTLTPNVGRMLTSGGVFAGILTGLAAGAPVLAVGKFTGNIGLVVAGTLTAVLAPAVIAAVASLQEAGRQRAAFSTAIARIAERA